MDNNEMDIMHLNPHHITDIKELMINSENVLSVVDTTNNIIHVTKNGSDETGNGSFGNPFLTIDYANNIAISMVNSVVDWDELVIVKVAPGVYTESITDAHIRVVIIGEVKGDFDHWAKGVILYNTGADADHYPIKTDGWLQLIGITIKTDSGKIFGKLPARFIASFCSFFGGYFIENPDMIVRAYFNFCYANCSLLNLTGDMNYSRFLAFRRCDLQSSDACILASTGSEKTLKLEYCKFGIPLQINGDWDLLMQWSEIYGTGKLTFDTNGYIDVFSSILVNGVHFYSDTPETKKCVNNIFKNTPVGEGDITADEPIEFIEYSGNHQHNGIDGEVITVSKIKNVGGGQNNYRNIHEALKGSLLQDTIINLEGDVEIDIPLVIPPNVDIQIDGNKKWKLTSTHATTLCELGATQQLSFVNMKQIIGGKKAILNGNGSTLSLVSCGRYTEPNYINIEVTLGNSDSFVYLVKTTLIGTGGSAIISDDINTRILLDRSHLTGDINYPAILFTATAHDKLKCKNTTLLHGGGTATNALTNTSGTKIVYVSIYGTAFNGSFSTANFTNNIVNASNVIDAQIDF